MSDPIHGDLGVRAAAHTARMAWSPSPSGTVWRKRVHLVGPPESGQVTSVVRYQERSRFPAHDHPDGEEILVLDGVFSDEHGDWPAGTLLLNPEGFRHEPFSEPGCTIFVKLRQYAGAGRRHAVIDTKALDWAPSTRAGASHRLLYEQPGFPETIRLERWAPGREPGTLAYPGGAELFVLEGGFEDEADGYAAGSWLRLPAGGSHAPRTREGCVLYVKRGGLAGLRDAAA